MPVAGLLREEDALRAEIAARPDDDLPRLIYADWLEERGEPRGELIRLQCELAGGGCDHDRRRQLETREAEVAAREQATALALLKPAGVGDLRFQRGMIEKVYLHGLSFLNRTRLLFRAAPTLRGVLFRAIDVSASADGLKRFFEAPQTSNLTSLDFSKNTLGRRGAAMLAECTRLGRIEYLNLAETGLSGSGSESLSRSSGLGAVRTWNLAANQLSPVDVKLLASARSLRRIETLILDRNHVGDAGLRAICRAPGFERLTTLSLADSSITPDGLRVLADSPVVTRLETLNLYHCRVGRTGASILASSSNFGRLKSLNLARCGVDDEAAYTLIDSPHLKRLESINLQGNDLFIRDQLEARFGTGLRL